MKKQFPGNPRRSILGIWGLINGEGWGLLHFYVPLVGHLIDWLTTISLSAFSTQMQSPGDFSWRSTHQINPHRLYKSSKERLIAPLFGQETKYPRAQNLLALSSLTTFALLSLMGPVYISRLIISVYSRLFGSSAGGYAPGLSSALCMGDCWKSLGALRNWPSDNTTFYKHDWAHVSLIKITAKSASLVNIVPGHDLYFFARKSAQRVLCAVLVSYLSTSSSTIRVKTLRQMRAFSLLKKYSAMIV